MPKENNKMQVDIDTLKKQNVNDLLSIKELYERIEELGNKITQIKYIDNTLTKKLKKEYEKLKKIILDENVQATLSNDIETVKTKLTNDIETINSQLNNIEDKIWEINVKDYGAKGDGVTDDTEAIQNALDNIPPHGILKFEPYKTYKTTSTLCKYGSNFKIDGNNSVIDYKGTREESILYVGSNLKKTFKNLTNFQINKQNKCIDLNYFLELYNALEVGDTILLTDNNSDNNGYKDGLLTIVLSKDDNKIYVSNLAHKNINVTEVSIFGKSENITISNIDINCSGSKRSIGLQINMTNKFKVSNCNINGDRGRQGINVIGFSGNIVNCTANNFFDELKIDNISGYGIAVSGKNIIVEKCLLENCKHTITASDRRFYSTNIIYRDNVFKGCNAETVKLCGAIVDIHGNAEGIVENNIIDAGEYHSGYLMYLRNDNIVVKNNVLRNAKIGIQKAIGFSDIATNNITIENNTVYGEGSIYIETSSEQISNVIISNNRLEKGSIYLGMNLSDIYKNINITNNIVYGDCLQFKCKLQDAIISNNILTADDSKWSTCIALGDSTESKNILINSNKLKHSGNGGTPIRFTCNNVTVTNNIIEFPTGNPINNMSSSASVLISNNMIDRGDTHEII